MVSSRMTLLGTALNLGEKMKIYPQVPTALIKLWLFHVVVLQTTATIWTKTKHARARRACKAVVFVH